MAVSYNLLISPVKQKINNLCNAHSVPMQHIGGMVEEPKNPPNYLRAWRLAAKLTQAELAQEANTSAAMINHLENGKRALTHAWLTRVSPALGTTPGSILDRAPGSDAQESRLRELWMISNDDERERIVRVAEAMLPYTPEPELAPIGGDPR
jgi:transcriptional regulator with XRE-family HTH domain